MKRQKIALRNFCHAITNKGDHFILSKLQHLVLNILRKGRDTLPCTSILRLWRNDSFGGIAPPLASGADPAFATVTFASHFLFPSVRWFFRRRLERAVAQLNDRLTRPIEPFKLVRRFDTVQRLSYDPPEVAKAIAEHCAETGEPEQVAFERVQRYAREIVPRFSAFAYFAFGIRIAKWISRAFYRVRLGGAFDEAHLEAVDKKATVVFVMNHRSNMDYVLVTWLAAERSHLSYAVGGEWARVWPLRALIRSMGGAYFIRRRSRNTLYRKVLARYVQMATDGGVTQAIFPEGGLSLNGEVGPPRSWGGFCPISPTGSCPAKVVMWSSSRSP